MEEVSVRGEEEQEEEERREEEAGGGGEEDNRSHFGPSHFERAQVPRWRRKPLRRSSSRRASMASSRRARMPQASSPRAIRLSPQYKKLRSSPQYRSEQQIRDFYQKLELERVRLLEQKKEPGDSNTRLCKTQFFSKPFQADKPGAR